MDSWPASGVISIVVWKVESDALFSFAWLPLLIVIIIHENTVAISFEIFILSPLDCPDEYAYEHQAKEDHAGDETVDDFHYFAFSRLNRVRMRAAFPMTSRELMGMEIAAINGVIMADMAKGTMMIL